MVYIPTYQLTPRIFLLSGRRCFRFLAYVPVIFYISLIHSLNYLLSSKTRYPLETVSFMHFFRHGFTFFFRDMSNNEFNAVFIRSTVAAELQELRRDNFDSSKNSPLILKYEEDAVARNLLGQIAIREGPEIVSRIFGHQVFITHGYDTSLRQLWTDNNHIFSVKTLLMVTKQAIQRLMELHDEGFTHNDLRPSNIAFTEKSENNKNILIVNRTYSTKWSASKKPFSVITSRQFASKNMCAMIQPSRADDIESLLYVMASLKNNGKLPWCNISCRKRLVLLREETTSENLFKFLSPAFTRIRNALKAMEYSERPCYERFIYWIEEDLKSRYATDDGVFDWTAKTVMKM